jgi:hypothetical protein
VGTGDVGLSATAFPSFQGPWAGLDVPGDIWMATTAPALPTRTQHAVSTARLHPSFLPSGVSRTIEPRQAGRPVAGRPARGGPKRHPRLGGQPGQRHAVLDMRAQQVPAAQRLAACARSASPAPAARARAAGSSTAGEPTSSRAQVVAGNAGFPATTGPGRTGSGPAEPHRRPRPASSTCTHSLRQTLLEAPSWARWSRSTTGRATTTPQECHQALKDQCHLLPRVTEPGLLAQWRCARGGHAHPRRRRQLPGSLALVRWRWPTRAVGAPGFVLANGELVKSACGGGAWKRC